MSNQPAAYYGASAALTILPVAAIITSWALALKRGAPIQSPPLRIAQLFLRITPPIYALGLILNGIYAAILAAAETSSTISNQILTAGQYLAITGGFLTIVASIAITIIMYLSTIASLYVVLGQTKWWKLLRLDAPIGGAILLVLAIAYYGRNMALQSGARISRADRSLFWLPLVIDLTLVLLTAGIFGTIIYVMSKLKSRRDTSLVTPMGKIPTLILVSSILWAISCCYSIAVTIKNSILEDWTDDEYYAQWIILPILKHWIGATVLLLLAFVIRNVVWADVSIQPTGSMSSHPGLAGQHQPVPVGMGQYPAQGPMQYGGPNGQYPQTQPQMYAYPQQGQPQPQMYVYPQQGQQQPQHPVYYNSAPQPQQYHELGQSPVGHGYSTGAPVVDGQK